MSIEIDIVLLDGETVEEVVATLVKRFDVDVIPTRQYNCHPCFRIYGTDKELRKVKAWHNASHKPRPDLIGKAPVAKGQPRNDRVIAGVEAQKFLQGKGRS